MTDLHLVRTTEEMQEFIWNLNAKIIQNEDVLDSDITLALKYQRDLNQHNLEKRATRAKKDPVKAALIQSLALEDL